MKIFISFEGEAVASIAELQEGDQLYYQTDTNEAAEIVRYRLNWNGRTVIQGIKKIIVDGIPMPEITQRPNWSSNTQLFPVRD